MNGSRSGCGSVSSTLAPHTWARAAYLGKHAAVPRRETVTDSRGAGRLRRALGFRRRQQVGLQAAWIRPRASGASGPSAAPPFLPGQARLRVRCRGMCTEGACVRGACVMHTRSCVVPARRCIRNKGTDMLEKATAEGDRETARDLASASRPPCRGRGWGASNGFHEPSCHAVSRE